VLAAAGIAAVLAGAMAAVLVVAGGVMAVLAAGGAIAVDAGAAVVAGAAGVVVAESSLWPLQALRASTAASDRAQIKACRVIFMGHLLLQGWRVLWSIERALRFGTPSVIAT
jgi:hypothetical protein